MKRLVIRFIIKVKDCVFVLKPHLLLGWLQHPLLVFSNTLALTKWIANQKNKNILNDFYSSQRVYSKRYQLYEYVAKNYSLETEPINYLEFGVATGQSFKWWCNYCKNPHSNFSGFDTFEGLPEKWGVHKKGEMSAAIPALEDERAQLVKGLFQDTLLPLLQSNRIHKKARTIIHLDADLFSATLFVLAALFPYLKKGDVILFDEFNVPNHEFSAFKIFTESFYVKAQFIGSVNNYYQTAFIIE
jgi:O-methyltransferase